MAREVAAIVVGVVVGYVTENPQLGFAAGMAVYGATAPNAKVEGPRLTDLKAPQASYGGVIPYIEGSPRTAGVYAWYSDKHEIANESSQGGKGGPGVDNTLFTYEIDALILFSINPLVGVRRIWSNGKLAWSQADDADAETIDASAEKKNWRELRFYSGADTQLPDPTYEAAVGIGNAPAYRGRASLFIEGLNLGQSGQLPVLTFEVVSSGNVLQALRTSTVYDAQVAVGLPSGIASYVGPRHVIYAPAYDNAYLNRDLITLTNIDAAPFYVVGSGSLPPLGGEIGAGTVNMLDGMADQSYWLALGKDGFVLKMQDSLGNPYDMSALSPNRRVGTYSRYSGKTLLMHLGQAPYITYPSGISYGEQVTETNYDPWSATLHAANWYVMPYTSNGTIYVYSSSLAAVGTIADPRGVNNVQGILCTDAVTGSMYMLHAATLLKWNGSSWAVYLSSLPGVLQGPRSSAPTGISVVGGALYSVSIAAGPRVIVSKGQLDSTLSRTPVPLDQVVSRMCLRTGLLTAADIDVTALAGDNVRAFAVSTVAPTRSALESLMAGFLFEAVEAEKIKFVKRGGAAVLTIPYKDLGASSGTPGDPLPLRRLNDIEQPARITVKYANTTNDYQDGAESGDRLVTQSTAISVVELPIGFTPGEAKRVADAHTMDVAVSLIGVGPVALTRKYPQLEPTDVLILTAKDGSTFRARIQKATAATGVNTFDLVLDDASVINSVAATDPNYNASTLIRLVSNSTLLLLDIPILRDTDNAPGIYAAVNAVAPWPGASLYRSSDNITYTKSIGTTTQVVTGVTTTLLGNWAGGAVFDETNAVTVNVGAGQLASVTRDVLLSTNQNALLIGSEIVQFRNAVLAGAGIYTVSGFMRGRRGTEWATGTHAVGERVVLLQATTLKRITESAADIGSPVWWKAVTIGKSVTSASAQVFTDSGVALKPFAPVDVRFNRDAASTIQITWKRRTRFSTRFCGGGGISVPLGETAEAYTVEIWTSAFGALKRTFTVYQPLAEYTVGQQIADFGSPQATLNAVVYQISSAVGNGYPSTAAGATPLVVVPVGDVLILNFDGSSNDGTGVHTAALFGDASVVSGSFVGGGALGVNGAGYCRVNQVGNSLDMGGGDYTFEAIFKLDDTAANQNIFTFGASYSARSAPAVSLRMSSGNVIYAQATAGLLHGNATTMNLTGPLVASGTRYHAAVQRRGDQFEFYFNGALASVDTSPTAYPLSGLDILRGEPFMLGGGNQNGSNVASPIDGMRGQIEALRVRRGQAIYSGLTYTVPTTPF